MAVILLLYYNKFTYINQQRRRLGRILIIYPDAARASPWEGGWRWWRWWCCCWGANPHTVVSRHPPGHHPLRSATHRHHRCRRYIYMQAIVYNYISSSGVQGRCVCERKGYNYARYIPVHSPASRRSLASRAHYSYSRRRCRRIIYPYPRLYTYIDKCVCVCTKANIYIYLYLYLYTRI